MTDRIFSGTVTCTCNFSRAARRKRHFSEPHPSHTENLHPYPMKHHQPETGSKTGGLWEPSLGTPRPPISRFLGSSGLWESPMYPFCISAVVSWWLELVQGRPWVVQVQFWDAQGNMEGKRSRAGFQWPQDRLLLTAFCLGLAKPSKSTQPTQQKQEEPHGLASWTPAPGNGSWLSTGQLGARGEGCGQRSCVLQGFCAAP